MGVRKKWEGLVQGPVLFSFSRDSQIGEKWRRILLALDGGVIANACTQCGSRNQGQGVKNLPPGFYKGAFEPGLRPL